MSRAPIGRPEKKLNTAKNKLIEDSIALIDSCLKDCDVLSKQFYDAITQEIDNLTSKSLQRSDMDDKLDSLQRNLFLKHVGSKDNISANKELLDKRLRDLLAQLKSLKNIYYYELQADSFLSELELKEDTTNEEKLMSTLAFFNDRISFLQLKPKLIEVCKDDGSLKEKLKNILFDPNLGPKFLNFMKFIYSARFNETEWLNGILNLDGDPNARNFLFSTAKLLKHHSSAANTRQINSPLFGIFEILKVKDQDELNLRYGKILKLIKEACSSKAITREVGIGLILLNSEYMLLKAKSLEVATLGLGQQAYQQKKGVSSTDTMKDLDRLEKQAKLLGIQNIPVSAFEAVIALGDERAQQQKSYLRNGSFIGSRLLLFKQTLQQGMAAQSEIMPPDVTKLSATEQVIQAYAKQICAQEIVKDNERKEIEHATGQGIAKLQNGS